MTENVPVDMIEFPHDETWRFLARRSVSAAPLAARDALCDNPANNTGQNLMYDSDDQAHEATLPGLLARITQHDQAALAALYDASASRLYGLALRITGERAAAEEVVSDVYFQVWNQAERYDAQRGRVMAWLLTICRSRALDKLRRRDQAEPHPDPQVLRPDLDCDDNDPLDLLLALERDSAIHAALATLDGRVRELLALAFFKGLSHEEIAQHTGMPLGSIKSILRRGMQALRPILEQAKVCMKEVP